MRCLYRQQDLAAKLQLNECAAPDMDRKGETIKAAICAGNFAEKYLAFEKLTKEEAANAAAEINAFRTGSILNK